MKKKSSLHVPTPLLAEPMTSNPSLHYDAQAGDHKALSNWLRLEPFWCDCKVDVIDVMFMDPKAGQNGWMCSRCCGLVAAAREGTEQP